MSRGAATRVSDRLAFVCWDRPDGSEIQSSPLPAVHAEALARAFARFWPEQAYVVKPLPWLTLTERDQ